MSFLPVKCDIGLKEKRDNWRIVICSSSAARMRILQICNKLQLNRNFNILDHGRTKLCFHLASQGKHTGLWQLNVRFHLNQIIPCQFMNRLHQERSTLKRDRTSRFAMAMEKMEITDEQIFQEKQRIEQEEVFRGKEKVPEVTEANADEAGPIRIPAFEAPQNGVQEKVPRVAEENADEAGPKIGFVALELRECWDLWQRIGLPVQKIAKQRHMTETGVFYCIFVCIQNNYSVDWYELCKESQFTLDIAKRMIQATEIFAANTSGGAVDLRNLREQLPADVSEVHFGLFVTMLVRGLSFETIRNISFQPGGPKPEMEWGDEYADEERFPKEATESRLLQWFAEKDGASLIEIALKFRVCDDLELMRLILKLKADGKIFWRQGVFRVVKEGPTQMGN